MCQAETLLSQSNNHNPNNEITKNVVQLRLNNLCASNNKRKYTDWSLDNPEELGFKQEFESNKN